MVAISIDTARRCYIDTLAELHVSDKAAAIDMGLDYAQHSRMKHGSGRERMSMEHLCKLPPEVKVRLLAKWLSEAVDAALAASKKPMAKMSLEKERQRESA